MRHFILTLLTAAIACTAMASDRYDTMSERALRAFDSREWASAAALYELMLDRRPDSTDSYVRAVVASEMVGDTVAGPDLVSRAMAHGIGLPQILTRSRAQFFDIGAGDAYPAMLYRLLGKFPWMRRAIEHELLDYYTFRDNGPEIIKYARIMLTGLPDSEEYRLLLARGYLLSGDRDAACSEWQSILDTDPNCIDALLPLGYSLAQQGDTARALDILRRAQSIAPTPYIASTIRGLEKL